MKFKNISLYMVGLVVASVMMGCSNSSHVEAERVGYLVTLSKNDIYYKCGNKEDIVNRNGKFTCSSFPVGFYRDNDKIGSIASLHNDGFVFPQDMQLEEESILKIASR